MTRRCGKFFGRLYDIKVCWSLYIWSSYICLWNSQHLYSQNKGRYCRIKHCQTTLYCFDPQPLMGSLMQGSRMCIQPIPNCFALAWYCSADQRTQFRTDQLGIEESRVHSMRLLTLWSCTGMDRSLKRFDEEIRVHTTLASARGMLVSLYDHDGSLNTIFSNPEPYMLLDVNKRDSQGKHS